MEPTNENGEPRGSGTERELVAELPVGERNTFSADDLPRDDEKEFKDLMAVVTDLQREVGHNWKLRDALQEELATGRTRHQEVEALLTARTREVERLEKERSSLQSENTQLTMELTSSEEERGEGVKEINRLKDDLEKKKQEIQVLEEKRSNLEETLNLTKREAEARERESHETIRQLKQDREKLEERLKQKTQEASRALALIEDLKREKQQLASELAHLQQTRANLKQVHYSLKNVQQMCNSPRSDLLQPHEDS
jgi:myosin protein heavy chain/myosin heavy chain 6/7